MHVHVHACEVRTRAQHPEMVEILRLHSEYKDLRKKGLKVKGWWFRLRARQILSELQPEANFCYSDAWFSGFKKRYRLSMRRATNTRQKEPADKRSSIAVSKELLKKVTRLGL